MPGRHADEHTGLAAAIRRWHENNPTPDLPPECVGRASALAPSVTAAAAGAAGRGAALGRRAGSRTVTAEDRWW